MRWMCGRDLYIERGIFYQRTPWFAFAECSNQIADAFLCSRTCAFQQNSLTLVLCVFFEFV